MYTFFLNVFCIIFFVFLLTIHVVIRTNRYKNMFRFAKEKIRNILVCEWKSMNLFIKEKDVRII